MYLQNARNSYSRTKTNAGMARKRSGSMQKN